MIDRWWDPALWRLPGLQDLPNEERVALLEEAKAATQWRRRVMIAIVLIWLAALFALAVHVSGTPGVRPPIWVIAAIPIPIWARLWRDRAVRRVVRERLRRIREDEIESIIATR